jgi:D-glycero-D-manno-heptose 1,7-bisphosphate phosphatase
MNKCIFLDRDGVINVDHVDYTYRLDHFVIIDGVIEALKKFKKAGYLLVVITNQSGIAKGIYKYEDMVLFLPESQALSCSKKQLLNLI